MKPTNRRWKIVFRSMTYALGAFVIAILTLWGSFWYLSGSPMGAYKFFATYFVASQFYMEPVSKKALFEGALRGMIDGIGEPHTHYLTEQEMNELTEETSGTYSGVGIVIGKNGNQLIVISPIAGQPAEAAGIVPGDAIVSIDGKPTEGMSLSEASRMMRGEAETPVTLGIRHEDAIKEVTITRKTIVLPTVKEKMLTDTIGYIHINQFGDHTGEEFAKAYQTLKQEGMKKIVLDLRNNPGGLLTAAQEVGSYLLPKGPIVTVQTRHGRIESYESTGLGDGMPLVVLINHGSASASEIIAAAVQDEKAGTIVGMKSYGKGTVQGVWGQPGNEGIKITIAKYHTPADRVIDKIGVTPDVEVTAPPMVPHQGEDVQLQKAIEILENQ